MKYIYRWLPVIAFVCMAVMPTTAAAQTVLDLTTLGSSATWNGARFEQGAGVGSSGTGIFDPFYRIKKANQTTVEGVNTGNSTVQFETEKGTWTTELLLSTVTQVQIAGVKYREFFLDINQTSGNAIYDMLNVQLWLDNQPDLNCLAVGLPGSWGSCDTAPSAKVVWWLDETSDATVRLNYNLEAGSGKRDMRLLIPETEFNAPPECDYGQTGCGLYAYLYSKFNPNDDGFEEWSTAVQPFVQITKTATGTQEKEVDWTIDKVVSPTSCALLAGDQCTASYAVTVTRSDTPRNARVTGAITLTVPDKLPDGDENAVSATVQSLTDLYAGFAATSITCPVGAPPFTISAGSTVICDYVVNLASAITGTNTATANVLDRLGVPQPFVATATVSSFTDTFIGEPRDINVDDYYAETTGYDHTWATSSTQTFTYERQFGCSETATDYDGGEYSYARLNNAVIRETGEDDDAGVTINCYAPTLEKTAVGHYTNEYTWEIFKRVDPAAHSMFIGDSGTSDYEVEVVRHGPVEVGHVVSGIITVHNPHPTQGMSVLLSDELSDGTTGALSCTQPLVVPAAGSADCGYEATPNDASATYNKATVTLNGYSDFVQKDFTFGFDEVMAEIDVDDTNGASWHFAGSATETYSKEFDCSTDQESYDGGHYGFNHPNTATIRGTTQDASADVRVDCYIPTVEKTALTRLTRTWDWRIDKSVTPETHALLVGGSAPSDYLVEVEATGYTDSDHEVWGTITFHNPNPGAPLTFVPYDFLDDDSEVALDCGPEVTVPAGSDVDCDYAAIDPTALATENRVGFRVNDIPIEYTEPFDYEQGEINEVYDVVSVVDSFNSGPDEPVGEAYADDGVTQFPPYPRTFECSRDPAMYVESGWYSFTRPNTARIVETGDSDDASVEVTCFAPIVEKTAETGLTRTYEWTIDKTVAPDAWHMFTGDTGLSEYTVAVEKTGYTDSGFGVSGTIIANNPAPVPMTVELRDELSTGELPLIACPGYTPANPVVVTLDPGSALTCTYAVTGLTTGAARTNTLTATVNGVAFSATAAVSFEDASILPVHDQVSVTDTNGESWGPVAGSASWTYTRTFACDNDAGEHDNVATIVETGQTDDALVTVTCYPLTVVKSVDETCFDRDWDWTLNKAANEGGLTEIIATDPDHLIVLTPSQPYQGVQYEVAIGATSQDSNWRVAGGIRITNPNPYRDAQLDGVTDVVSPDIAAAVSCPSMVVPKGEYIDCTYTADLPNADTRTNQATALLRNHDYVPPGYVVPLVVRSTPFLSNVVDVEFGETPCIETDECAVWADTFFGDDPGTPQLEEPFPEMCANLGAPIPQPSYPVEILRPGYEPSGPSVLALNTDCDMNVFPNTASLQITGVDGEDDPILRAPWFVAANVECDDGCTLTQGYWKTHNESFHADKNGNGPMPDLVWWTVDDDYLDFGSGEVMDGIAADGIDPDQTEPFFLSGQSWFEVFWTAPGGNKYYNLAHQWMAAHLNTLAGASVPAEVQEALDEGQILFETYTPAELVVPTGKDKKGVPKSVIEGIQELNAEFNSWAGILGDFNEGLIGPGHCDDNGYLVPDMRIAGTIAAALAAEQPVEDLGAEAEKAGSDSAGEQRVDTEDEAYQAETVEVAEASAPVAAPVEIPSEFEVGNYPNPFNPQTTIRIAVPEASHVRVTVHDILGRTVALLVDESLSAGTHSVTFDGSRLPSGVYLVRLDYQTGSLTRLMQLLK